MVLGRQTTQELGANCRGPVKSEGKTSLSICAGHPKPTSSHPTKHCLRSLPRTDFHCVRRVLSGADFLHGEPSKASLPGSFGLLFNNMFGIPTSAMGLGAC